MKSRHIPVLAALSMLVACGDKNPTAVDAGISGTLSFTYTGGGGGSFNATGAISNLSGPSAQTTTWATGWKSDADNSTVIVANISRAGGLADFAVISINSQVTGTSSIDALLTCSPSTTQACNFVFLAMGSSFLSDSPPSSSCFLESGTITISTISSTNATGTFSGSGSCFSSSVPGTSVFTVTNGSFNVPLQAAVPL